MHITRRDFLKFAAASAMAIGLSDTQLKRAQEALAAPGSPPVIWLSGAACTGCSVSLLNAVYGSQPVTVDQVLLDTVSLRYHTTLMAAGGDLAVAATTSAAQAGGYILVVEGAVPTGADGRYCYVWEEAGRPVTMVDAVSSLAPGAARIIAVGTCAAYGGIPGASDETGATGIAAYLTSAGVATTRPVVNLPGCPTHPDWIVGTIVHLLGGTEPALDSYSRPTTYYPRQVIHERCPRRGREEADQFGMNGLCLQELGCKGSSTHADCDLRLWNNRQNWCIGANGLCLACTEPSFPSFPLHHNEDEGDD